MKKVKSSSPFRFVGIAALVTLLFVSGCSALHQKRRIPKCKSLYGLVGDFWQRDSTNGLYPMKLGPNNGLDGSVLECQECFIGLQPREFERLFGKPDTFARGHLVYFLTEPCNSKKGMNANGCFYLDCILDAERKVKGVTIAMDSYQNESK